MRSLLSFRWCLLSLLLGWVSSVEDCDWKMPVQHAKCEQTIKYKVYNDKQALATCLEHFPTTFVEGTKSGNEIKCTVYRQFQCDFIPGSVSIFDKCYTFHKEEVTMVNYLSKTTRPTFCAAKDGKGVPIPGGIPVFITITQAKHIAMEAHRQGISKIWVNVDSEGKTIEKSGDMESLTVLYKEQWKLHQAHYWEGEKLHATPMINNQYEIPGNVAANYLFFRSKNDHWNNLIQGSFELATRLSKASIVCEYQAKIVPNQEKYCARLGDKGLGLNAKYGEFSKRCVYTTLSQYALMGTQKAIKDFPGCKETPSPEEKAGLDDGTASINPRNMMGVADPLYTSLTSIDATQKTAYRVAAIKSDTTIHSSASRRAYSGKILEHCSSKAFQKEFRQPYETYNQFEQMGFGIFLTPEWEDLYPKDECTDFPAGEMNSNTLAVRNGLIIDVPVPVRFPAVCSIQSNKDCELHNIVCTNGKVCVNVDVWNKETNVYASCDCPKFHFLHDGKCKWTGTGDTDTAWVERVAYDAGQSCAAIYSNLKRKWINVATRTSRTTIRHGWSDYTDRVVVRYGCQIKFWAHPEPNAEGENYESTGFLKDGEHIVPNDVAGTLYGWDKGMSVSAHECSCDSSKTTVCEGSCTTAPGYTDFFDKLGQ